MRPGLAGVFARAAAGLALAGALLSAMPSFVGPAIGAGSDAVQRPEEVEAIVRKQYIHGMPFAELRSLGPSAMPRLVEMLHNSAERPYWSNVVSAIGMIGASGSADVLISFIEAQSGRALDGETYRAALTAVLALGYVANRGDQRALAFLTSAVSRERRSAVPPTDLRLDDDAVAVQAVLGLALSAQPQAREMLERLQRSGQESVRERAKEAMAVFDRVSNSSLEAYFGSAN